MRGTCPVEVSRAASVEIQQASSEDFAVISALSDELTAFHSRAPIFWPLLTEPHHAAEEAHRGLLADPRNAHFVAYEGGQPVAMQTFARPGFTPSIVEPEGNVYLFEGMVEERARSGGIGTALLNHSMAWAREQGDERCTLHFASANPSGAPFWLSQGFVPVEYQMARHVDERVAWARDW
ncbi:MAG: GNAT family N-acetyltransferase [Tepidiformaceae bacterium]